MFFGVLPMFKICQKCRPTMHQHRIDGKWTTFQQPTFQNKWFEGVIIKLTLRTRVWICCNGKSERTLLLFLSENIAFFLDPGIRTHGLISEARAPTVGVSSLWLDTPKLSKPIPGWLTPPILSETGPQKDKTNRQTMAVQEVGHRRYQLVHRPRKYRCIKLYLP